MGILYIEDDYITRTEITVTLLRTGRKVFAVASCEQARKIFEKEDIKLVVTDIKLPDGDGLMLANEFRNVKPELKVIILTAFEAYFFDLKKLQLDAFLVKPVYMKNFLSTVDDIYKATE